LYCHSLLMQAAAILDGAIQPIRPCKEDQADPEPANVKRQKIRRRMNQMGQNVKRRNVITLNRNASMAATTTVSMSSEAKTELITEGLRNRPVSATNLRRPPAAYFLPETITCCR
jgi:hypothetical protein